MTGFPSGMQILKLIVMNTSRIPPPPSYKSNWDTLNENLRHLGPIFLIWDIRFLGLATDLKIDVSHHGITRYKMYCPPLPNVLRKFGDFVQ